MKKLLIVLAIIIIPIFIIGGIFVSFQNRDVELTNRFNQKKDERTAFYDKMAKIIKQKAQVALKNDSSFHRSIDAIMAGRKDAEQVMMKWITESNPNANFSEVSSMYKDLSRSIESERLGFFEQEKVMQDIVRESNDLKDKWPGSFVVSFLGRGEHLKYTPIQSDVTADVMRTGRDNNTEVF